jgi:hypothetical protein
MRSSSLRMIITIVVFALVGCAPAASQIPSSVPSTTPMSSSAVASLPLRPSEAVAVATGAPSVAPTSHPTRPPSTGLPIRGSAREISSHDVLLAPGPDGGVFVLIPSRTDPPRLALLDASGGLRAGWPVRLPGADYCDQLLPADDGSVRVVCTQPNPEGNMYALPIAYGFELDGRVLDGWPIHSTASYVTGRIVGDTLVLLAINPLGDVIPDGQPSAEAEVLSVGRDGMTTPGVRVPIGQVCCDTAWAVGPDGVAYGVGWPDAGAESTRVTAFGRTGTLARWPVSVGGIGITPAFAPGGRIVMAVGSSTSGTTRVVVVDRDGAKHPSGRLPIKTFEISYDTGSCTVGRPRSPLTAGDGTTFLYSELDDTIYALDPSLEVKSGWPFEPASALQIARPGLESEHEAGYCPTPVVPAVGTDSTLYLALETGNSKVGGSLVAVGPNGRVRSGWPVALKRAGSEFWSVVAGSDGTVFALAIEPEAGRKSSASILAIAPDSTVRWTTTIVDP